jgi:hypothetical protein
VWRDVEGTSSRGALRASVPVTRSRDGARANHYTRVDVGPKQRGGDQTSGPYLADLLECFGESEVECSCLLGGLLGWSCCRGGETKSTRYASERG